MLDFAAGDLRLLVVALQAVLRRLLVVLSMAVDAPAHFELRDRHEISDVRVRTRWSLSISSTGP